MRKKGILLFLIAFIIFLITSCSSNENLELEKVIKTLEIKEDVSKVENDFYVPKIMQYEEDFYPIVWSTESTIIKITEEKHLVFIDIDFEEVSTELHREIIVATIRKGTAQASKSFAIFPYKESSGSNDNTGTGTGNTGTGTGNTGTGTGNTGTGTGNTGTGTGNTGTGTGNTGTGTGNTGTGTGNTGTGSTVDLGKTTGDFTFTRKPFSNRLGEDGPLTEEAFPSIGNPKMLVIPVNLKDSEATIKNLRDIKQAFTGTSNNTGWESVQSYYQKSSYGKLNMEITVLNEWFKPSKSVSYYNSYSDDDSDGSTVILREALEYYDSKIDFSEYDYDKDGYIDGVWLIYNYDVDFNSDDSIFWAYTYWNFQENQYDGVKSYYYAWAGIDFMHPTKDEAGYYDPTDIKVDAHTYIHETGHMLGLDDYYDYDENAGVNSYGFYGRDMMDYNIGDHSAISKLLLGWADPIVAQGKGTGTIELKSFTTSGDFIIVTDHTLSSIYDTYWTIEFFTNDGLNEHDKLYDLDTAPYGIRIMEIHAEKNIVNGEVTENSGTYQTGFKYDNSDESKMFADGIYEKTPTAYNEFSVNADCLYQVNEEMKKSGLPFELVVTAMTNASATITITIK